MVPAHRDFAQSQSSAMRTEKKFDIEREADGVRSFENRTANLQPKCFETALSVPKRHSSRESHDQIKNAAGLLASPRLANADQFPIERARTECKIDISIRDGLDHF